MRYCCCVAHSRACSGGGGGGEHGVDAHGDAHRVRTEDTHGETTGGTAVEILISRTRITNHENAHSHRDIGNDIRGQK